MKALSLTLPIWDFPAFTPLTAIFLNLTSTCCENSFKHVRITALKLATTLIVLCAIEMVVPQLV